MKKQLFWALTLVLLALFPYQSVRADYCSPAGNMTNTHTTGKILDRKFTSFTLSDGTNSVSLDNIQTSYTDAIYKDRTSEVLTTTVGATLNFSAMSEVSWMHGYVYIDYNGDETFSNTANNNGTTGGELVSYNYYNEKNINNATMAEGCGVSASNIPSWTLPSNLTPGEYRLRFKIDWNSLDPCGSSDMASNNGCVVDITLKVLPSYPKMTYFYSGNIQQSNRYLKEVVATQGGNTTTVFSASSENDLPRVDPTGANTVLNEAQGALVDKTQNPISIDYGASEFSINFKAWTNNMNIGGESKSSELNWTQQAVFIDWNNDLDFLDSGENYGKSGDEMPNNTFVSEAGYTRTISIPQGVQPGTYRMRVCYYEPDAGNSDNWHEKLFTEYGAKTRNGKSYDFAINVVSPTYTINVASTAGGSAVITAEGSSGTSATVNLGSSVTLTATPNSGFIFVNWTNSAGTVVSTDATYTFNATKTDTYTANFVKECTVSVTIPDATQGTITINGEEATASHTITEGTPVELRANPKAGYKFEKWVINGSEQTANPYTTTVTSDMTVSAVFAAKQTYTVSVSANNNDMGTVNISASEVLEGETVTLTATPNIGYLFVNWTVGGAEVSRSATYEATVTAATAYVANFAEKQYCKNFGTSTRTAVDRNLVSLNFNDDNNTNTAIAVNQTTGSGAQIYFDKTSNVITLAKGIDVTPAINWNGWAMHGYLYVDWNGDKEFTPRLGANGVPTEDSEIIAYSYYNGRNHKGTSVGESTDAAYPKAMPNFTIPGSIQNGEYRARYMIVWSKMDPCTLCNTDNAPVVVDFTIKVTNATPSNSRKQDLFTSANISQANNIYPYRIPGITSTNKDGRLIATAARLVCGTDPGYGRVDAVCRISDDNGVTWGAEKTIAAGNENLISATQNVFEIAYGDPAVVADRESGEVIVIVVAGCTTYQAATRSNPNMIGIIRSENYGDTWGTPENITEQIYSLFDNGNPIQSAFVAGGKVFQSRVVKVGNYYRLYAAMCARPNGNRVIYSDDFGRTWKPLGGAAASITPDNGNEPKCEELPDGRVILSSRNANGNGRLYNIYTYTNTATGAGSWSSCTASTFEGSNHAPGSNNTNGEILIVPVKRNNDSKEMYLALQSQPTGSDRVNVGIYYKELTNLDDMNTVSNFATGWNGFYQVSTTQSAYSSMDLQDDGKVGFFYEETLTRDGTVANPTTTCLSGGTHNFDGYNNIYRAFTIEQLTNNAYSLKTDVNRGNFVKTYLTSVVDVSNLPTATKNELKADITAMGNNPTTEEVDAIYSVLYADPWDGKVVTFTNIQSNGDQRALYINNSVLSLGTTSQTAESIGASAQFLCTKQANGKYTFRNIATNNYMIWIGSSDGYNNNTGTLSTYNATYCDWSINDANSTKAGTYCLVSKRGDGTTDGSLVVAQSNGAFDTFGADPICGTHTNGSNYSNVYYINIVSSNVEQTLATAKTLINKTGVGYPKANASARTTLQNAIAAAEANPTAVAGITLQNAINTYYAATDIELPANGVLYSFIVGHGTQYYIYNNGGTLAVAPYTKGTTVLPETAKFTCEVNGNYFMFRTSDGNYMAFPSYGSENYTDASPDGIEAEASDKTKFSITKLYNNVNADVTESNESLFGKTYLTVLLRGTVKEGDHAGEKQSGVFVIKIGNDYRFDGAAKPYDNGSYSSAISVVAMGYPLTATAEPAGGGTATVSPTSVSAGGSATFTASAANAGYVFDGWYNGNEKLTGELVYNATNITTPLSLTAKYIQQGVVSVTVPSEFGKVMKGEDVVEGSISGNVGEIVQLTAVADEGYIFDRWVVKNTSTNQIRLKSTSTIDVELGTYEVEAYFAPEAYAQICKPTFVKSGNVFTVQSASISNGVGVENIDIVGTAFNMKNAGEVQTDLGEPAQWGATKAILVEPGATFTLNVEYMKNWADVELFINEGDGFTTIYGPYEGSDAAGLAFTNMENDNKISTSGNIASFPITISNDLEGGDIVVIRSASGSFEGNACKESLDQGGYLDFVFVVKNLPKRTVSVQVRPSDAAESVTINGLEQTTLTASGDITINVEPKDGYRFVKWTDVLGNDVSTDKEYVDNSTKDTTYVANLVKLWKVTVATNNRAWGIADISGVDANGFVDNAADVTLTATSNNDARFVYWGLRTTENGEEVIKPVTTTNPFKTTILRNEDYVAVFEGDYPTMRLKYENGSGTDDERRVNRYLASVTATAGDLTTVVFEATNESGLPRIDAEVSAFYKHNEENLIPTTSGALIDKTGNAIMVKKGTETITLNFKSWLTNISLRSNTAEPELDQTQQAIFVDWNNNKDFLDDGENLGIVSSSAENSFEARDGYNRQISIPASAECGTYRMRVIYYDNLGSSDDWTSTIFNDCVINQGRAYDFEIDIVDDTNYITFNAPGETYFNIGDKANIQVTYPDNNAVIYYTTDGFDPDENSPSIANGGAIAINTLQEGTVTLKAMAKVGDVKSQVYTAVYTVVSKSSNLGAPTLKSAADATTIIAAEISQGVGIANGPIDYNFTQGQQVKLNAIPTTATAIFSLDVTLDLNKYGLLIYRLDALKESTQKSIKLTASYTADEIISVSSFKNTLDSEGFSSEIIDEAEGKIKIKIPVVMEQFADLSNGESVIYRLIVTNKAIGNNVTLLPDQDYGIGEYVDFVFTVSPQTTKTKVAGGAGKQLSFTITTDNACYLSVGGYAQNIDEAGTTTIQAPLNVVGEMEIQSVGANISKMDVEILEYGTNVVLPNVDYLGTVTVKSDADLNATTISYASQLPADSIHLVVEKEIKVPHVNDNDPTYFNFLSMPFEFDCGLNIEYWDGDSWETAVLEKDIRILKYNSRTRSQGKDYYDYTWNTIGGTGGMIYANEGFVLVGNSDHGDANHKMKIRFKSFYPTDNTNVKRELKYFQDGGIKTVGVLPYRNTQGETHVCDADWNHIGSPYLTYTDAIDYVVYYHNGYSYQSVSPSENRQVRPFESFMFQANMEQLNQKDIAFFPLSANNQNSALNVYGRAYLAINGEESVKVILNDEASENFVVNEDGWYMAPTTDVFSTMSLKVAGSEASMSVQPEPNELPLTVYVGANAQQTISLSRFDGENNIFLKDAITEEVVCLNDEDYTFTATPYSTIANRFTVSMIEPTGICDQPTTDGNIKAVVTADGIKLFGTVEGDEVTLYTANGMVIANAIAEDGITNIETSANGVIIIKVAEETVKIVK